MSFSSSDCGVLSTQPSACLIGRDFVVFLCVTYSEEAKKCSPVCNYNEDPFTHPLPHIWHTLGKGWGETIVSSWFDNYCFRLVSEPFYNPNSGSPFAANIWSGDERRQKGFKSYAGQLCSGPGIGAIVVWRGFVVRVWLFASFGNCWDVRSHIVSIIFYSFLFNSLPNVSDAHQDSWTWLKTEAVSSSFCFSWGSPGRLSLGCYVTLLLLSVLVNRPVNGKASSTWKTKGESNPSKSSLQGQGKLPWPILIFVVLQTEPKGFLHATEAVFHWLTPPVSDFFFYKHLGPAYLSPIITHFPRILLFSIPQSKETPLPNPHTPRLHPPPFSLPYP